MARTTWLAKAKSGPFGLIRNTENRRQKKGGRKARPYEFLFRHLTAKQLGLLVVGQIGIGYIAADQSNFSLDTI